nr:response regulator transcription factor [uncultured Caldimonas sp.]
MPIALLLVDDHRLVREGLRRVLESCDDIRVAGEAESGHEALEVARREPLDVVVTDLTMPGLSGIDLIRRFKAEFPELPLLVLTMHAEEQYALRAFRAGANGYMTKDCATDQLVGAVRKVAAGGAYVSPALAERLAIELNGLRDAPLHTLLSDREFEVFRLIVAGKRLTEIADMLHLSVKTVSTHKTRILEKMHLDNAAALIKYGLTHKLFDDGASG